MDTGDVDPGADPGPAIGLTGARFGGAPRRRRTARGKAAEADTAAIPAVPVAPDDHPDAPDGPVVGLTGARFGRARRKRGPNPAPADPRPAAPPPPPPPPDVEVEEPVAGGSAFVRPYVFTRGRTLASLDLSIETLVSACSPAEPRGAPGGLTGEHLAVLDLCREPRSLAELAAHARVPLGVARVLVGDLAAAGAVAVHRAAGPDVALMRRVLGGLRKL